MTIILQLLKMHLQLMVLEGKGTVKKRKVTPTSSARHLEPAQGTFGGYFIGIGNSPLYDTWNIQ